MLRKIYQDSKRKAQCRSWDARHRDGGRRRDDDTLQQLPRRATMAEASMTIGFPKGSFRLDRAKRRMARDRQERDAKAEARQRDRGCRFPACGCRSMGFALHVAHLEDKGMGGNPRGDRSTRDKLITLCAGRHLANRISLHGGTLRIEPLTARGTDGPCKFLLKNGSLKPFEFKDEWWEVARERRISSTAIRFELVATTPEQDVVLDYLSGMKV